MKTVYSCLLLLWFFVLSSPGSGLLAVSSVEYSISLAQRDRNLLDIQMRIQGITAEHLKVALPTWNNTYMVRDFVRFIQRIEAIASDGGTLPMTRTGKSSWNLQMNGHSEAAIRYSIEAALPGSFSAEVTSKHAFLHAALICLFLPDHRSVPHRVQFEELPNEWRIATGLDQYRPGIFQADDYDHLVDSPLEISDFDERSFGWQGVQYQIVVDGREDSFSMDSLVEMLQAIVTHQVELMGAPPFKRYVFLYHVSEEGSGGMEHRNSTAIGLRRSAVERGIDVAASVSAHEFFHLWNVKRIRPAEFDRMNWLEETPTRALWFSEGGTSYYALLTLVRTGIIDEAQFYGQLTSQIRRLSARPARLFQSAERSSWETWFDRYSEYRSPENSISYYNKGLLISLLLDLEIRHRTENQRSLDDVFRFMNVWFGSRNIGFQPGDIQRAVEAVAQSDFQSFFERYVAGVEELPYSRILGYAGLQLTKRDGRVEVESQRRSGALAQRIRKSLLEGW